MRSAFLRLVSLSGSSTFSIAVSTGIRLNCWKMNPTCSLRQWAIARSLNSRRLCAQHVDLSAGRAIHGGDQMQQRRFARTRRAHQRDELALADLQAHVLQRDHVELVAHVFLGQVAGFNDDFAHEVDAFWRTLSPSFRSAGGLRIKIFAAHQSFFHTDALRTGGARLHRSVAAPCRRAETKTAPSRRRTWEYNHDRLRRRALSDLPVSPRTAKATLAFISGRRYWSGLQIFTFTCTVAFWRLASGEISLMKPSYLRSGKRVRGDGAVLLRHAAWRSRSARYPARLPDRSGRRARPRSLWRRDRRRSWW